MPDICRLANDAKGRDRIWRSGNLQGNINGPILCLTADIASTNRLLALASPNNSQTSLLDMRRRPRTITSPLSVVLPLLESLVGS